MDVESTKFDAVASKLSFKLATKPSLGAVTGNAAVTENKGNIGMILDVYKISWRGQLSPRVLSCRISKSKRNKPFGQVPAFEDGDLKLFESRAITQYIAHVYASNGNQLILQDPKKMSIISVWMEVEGQKFEPPSSKLTWELGVKPMIGMTTDDAAVKESEEQLSKVLDIYEARLAESKYLGGDSFTLVDLHHLPNIYYLMGTKVKALFDSRPRVSAWCADILARSAWVKGLAKMKN